MKSIIICLTLLVSSSALRAATVTIQGGQTNQVIEGFGVNANRQSWNNDELKPVLDALIDQAGMTLFRVIYDNTDWEVTNDNADSNVINWDYYNPIYANPEFARLWDTMAYLNQRGITNGAILSFMGYGRAWMCGSANFNNQVLTAGLEDEWAEMIASAVMYARNTRGLQFRYVTPNNEPDLLREGIHLSGSSQYTNCLHRLAVKLNANGLSDVRLIGPDYASTDTGVMSAMMANPLVMSKVEHFTTHGYSAGAGSSGVLSFIKSSAYPGRTLWQTEFNVWCSTCDDGTRGTYDWAYCRGTAEYLLSHLANGASAGLVYEGYDSYYAHHAAWGFWGLFSVNNENAAVKTYTPRKNFYTVAQISKWVRPGAQRINITGSTSPFTYLQAYKHTGLGQVTIVGINTSGSAATLAGTLASLPTVTSLNLYHTSATANLANGGSVAVNGSGVFSATIPADCVFTLVGSTGVSVAITAPVNGAQFNAPATIPIAATATTSGGSIELVGFYNGTNWLGDDTVAPYGFTWNNVPMGNYSLTALGGDSLGNVGTSAVVNVAVVGPLGQIVITPTNASVVAGGTQQFVATGIDIMGHTLNPQPAFSWSASGGGTMNGAGLFTAGGSAGGPFNVVASSGSITKTATVSVTASGGGMVGGGTLGNTNEGTSVDGVWDGGAWINTCRFLAASNINVSMIRAKVTAITGKYRCAIYTGSSSTPSRVLRSTAEVTNPGSGWQTFSLTSAVTLTNGQYYWLAIWSDSSSAKVYYSGSNGTLRWGQYNYAATWPDPISTTGGNTFNYCIYAMGTAATLSSIAVTPVNPTILAGGTQQFVATGTYSDGSTQNITSQTTWSSSSANVASVNTTGLATGLAAGTTTISAALNGVSGSGNLTVQSAPLIITTTTLPGGAVGVAYGAALAASGGITPYAWSLTVGTSLPPGLTINTASGAISGTPTIAGNFNFTVQANDSSNPIQTTTKFFSVTIAPALTAIAVTPTAASVMAGAVQQMTATGTYSDGSMQNVTSQATWISSNMTVATVSTAGLVTGVSGGNTVIAAVIGGIVGNTPVTVVPPPEGLGDYRTVGSGTWNDPVIWQTNNGMAWVTALRPPTNAAAGSITLRAGHIVTMSSAVTVDQVIVESGGQLTVNNVTLTVANGTGTDLEVSGVMVLTGTSGVITPASGATIAFKSGATYQHARTTGAIPTATWDANSTCLITGSTSALPSGLGQTFGHFTWNCAGQSSALNLETSMNVAGDFVVLSTGSSTLRLLNSSTARTVMVGGSYRQSGGTFNLKNSSGNAALNIAGDFIQSGGTFTLRSGSTTGAGAVTVGTHFSLSAGTFNLSSVGAVGTLNVGGDFTHTGGTITETSSGSGGINFNGSAPQNYTSGGTVANTINFTVNSSATLLLGTSLLGDGSSGTFTLSSGATLGVGHPAGIAASGATGNIRVTGARSFSTGANYLYNGSASQVTGSGLPATLNDLVIANQVGLILNTTNTVNGTCTVSAGSRLVGSGRINNGPLTLSGNLSPGINVGRLTTARQIWNGSAVYEWEINNASGATGVGWDLLSLTSGQGVNLQATAQNPFTLKLVSLNGTNSGLAANFSKTNNYTWPIAICTNATITNFTADKVFIDSARFSNDIGSGTFSLDLSGQELRLKFAPETAQLIISTATLSNGSENVSYTTTLTHLGGVAPHMWSIISGSLPPGLSLGTNSGAITGIPTTAGTFNFMVNVRDSTNPVQNATKSLSITIEPALTMITLTPSNPTILAGSSQQFIATATYSDGSTANIASQATWVSSNAVVATVNASGLATGASAGKANISATLNGVSGSAQLTVQTPLVITTSSLPGGPVNADYSGAFAASGGTAPYTWSISVGTLPVGLTLDTNSGAISGIPTTAGTNTFTVRVTDTSSPAQTTNKGLSIVITKVLSSIAVSPVNPGVLVGGTQQFTATGTYSDGSTANIMSQATWVSSNVAVATVNASGLSTGVSAGTASITATLSGVSGSAQLTVQTPVVIATSSLPGGTANANYSGALAASGGTSPYTWSITVGTLPTGLTLDTSTGAIGGVPTAAGTNNFTVRVTDTGNPVQTTNKALSIVITKVLSSIVVTPVNPTVLVGGTQQFTATGTYSDGSTANITSQATWVSSSTVVATINASGLATGVSAGTASITATLGGVSGSTVFTLQALPLVISTITLSTGSVSVAYSSSLAATGGTTPYRWSLLSGTLPLGLTLNTNSGAISGTPTTNGTFNFTARVNDTGNPAQTTNKALSITIVNLGGVTGTLGNTNDGTSSDNLWDSGAWINATRFQATSNFTVTTMRAKVFGITGKYKCAIYGGSSSQPSQLLGSTTEVTNPTTGWQSFSLTSSVSVTNGQYYWLAVWSDSASARVYYSGNNGTLRWGRLNYGTWPSPLSTSGGGTLNYCVYAMP